MIIPQTRTPIQVLLHKSISFFFTPEQIEKNNRKILASYDWQLNELSGSSFNLIQAKQKVTIINFWATWCPPCIAEMPSLQELYNHFHTNENVSFVFMTTDSPEKIHEFMEENEFNFQVYSPAEKAPELLTSNSIPRTIILNQQGELMMDHTGAANWYSQEVIQLLNQLLEE